MASEAVLPGFAARSQLTAPRRTGTIEVQLVGEYAGAELTAPRRTGRIEVQLVGEYAGAELAGQRFLVRNLGKDTLPLGAERAAPAGALAFAYGRPELPAGEATSAFLVFRKGGLE
jgi:conjugal transfer pilus assembly protein TraK